ncbi:hypothetical protein BIW11_11202 [Tropilaelaps mercedesae]|uniref:Uncharacterized protein n=1 Tax=Tropilaelaps mercedesae TaxID=418985 RepID=A0A1V9XC40_9ACAR|nr:hypothetical protein BIW11_11202 [Tropilaelaps mercedesae]
MMSALEMTSQPFLPCPAWLECAVAAAVSGLMWLRGGASYPPSTRDPTSLCINPKVERFLAA